MGNRTKHLSRQKRLAYIQHQNERELAFAKTLAERKPAHKSWKQRIEAFYHQSVPEEQLVSTVDRELHQLFSAMAAKKLAQRICFRALLLHLDQQKCQKLLQDPDYLTGLFALSSHVPTIRQPVKTWRRTSHNTEKQLVSLINHCFVRYAVPPFFYRVWLNAKKTTQQRWFIDLAQGEDYTRQVGKLPVAMTKKMGHFFTQAAATLTVEEALRWAQAKGMGGSDSLAQAIAGSCLSRNEFKEERLWETVIRFLVQQPKKHAPRVGEVIELHCPCFRAERDLFYEGQNLDCAVAANGSLARELRNRERKLGGRYTWEASGRRGARGDQRQWKQGENLPPYRALFFPKRWPRKEGK